MFYKTYYFCWQLFERFQQVSHHAGHASGRFRKWICLYIIPCHLNYLSAQSDSYYIASIVPYANSRMIISHLIHHKRQIHAYRFAIGACARATLNQWDVVVEDSGGYGIGFGFLLCLAHQWAERGQGGQLAVGEKLMKFVETISCGTFSGGMYVPAKNHQAGR